MKTVSFVYLGNLSGASTWAGPHLFEKRRVWWPDKIQEDKVTSGQNTNLAKLPAVPEKQGEATLQY